MKTVNTPRLKLSKRFTFILAAGFALAAASTGHAQTLLLSLQAQNYNATTGVWTDSSGNGNNATNSSGGVATSTAPTRTAGVTPNGSPAVTFTTLTYLTLSTGITAGNAGGYTAFVFLRPSTTQPNGFTNGAGGAIFGGPGGAFQFRLSNGKQDIVRAQQADLGAGNTVASTTSFSTIDTTTGPSGGTYRFNGAADGTSIGSTYTNSINFIGTNANGSQDEYFNGNIADIEIYSGLMTDTQRATVEAQISARYVTVPEPSTWAMALVGVGMLVGVQRFRARKA